jgi:hypothetical protein
MKKLLVIKHATETGYAGFLVEANEGTELNGYPFNPSGKFSALGAAPGAIYEVELNEEGTTITYKQKARPVALWHNPEDVKAWRAKHIAAKNADATLKAIKVNTLYEALAPVKMAYRNSNTNQRTALLAEIIRYVTT